MAESDPTTPNPTEPEAEAQADAEALEERIDTAEVRIVEAPAESEPPLAEAEPVPVAVVEPVEEAVVPPPPMPVAPPAPPVVPPAPVAATEHAAAEPPVEALYTAVTPPQQVVYVHAPVPPRLGSNRGIGSLIAVAGAVVFGVLLAGAWWLVQYAAVGATGVSYLATWDFYIPVAIFAIAAVVVVLLVNRARWGAHVLGSLFVGAAVYFGSIGVYLLLNALIFKQVNTFDEFMGAPQLIVAAVLAREVAVWFGWFIARRGRRVTERNAAARTDFEQRLAEFHAETR